MSNLRVLHVDLDTGQMVAKAGSVGNGGGGNGNYVNVSGSTMTGSLVLHDDPSVDLQAATKRYVDLGITSVRTDISQLAQNISAGMAQLVSKSGDTMTGPLRLANDPQEPSEAATKQYVDNGINSSAVLKTGSTMTGMLQLAGDPVLDYHAATKGYIDRSIAGIVDVGTYLPLDGGIMTGHIELVGDPTEPNHPATKEYVDANAKGISFKSPVRVATNNPIGTLSGFPQIDGVQLSGGDRVLVKNETNPIDNGIYVATSSSWIRADDATGNQLPAGAVVYVSEGDQNSDSGWIVVTDGIINVGTDPINFILFSATKADDQFVDVAGDQMAGALLLVGDPTENDEAANKGYIDRKINEIGDKYLQDEPSSVWIVEHNRNTTRVMVQVFDSNGEMVLPSKIKLQDANSVRIEFGSSLVTGSTELLFL